MRDLLLCGALLAAALAARPALAQTPTPRGANPAQARDLQQRAAAPAPADMVGGWPKISFDTVASLDYAGMSSKTGPDRGPGVVLWSDSTLLVDFNDALSLDALFQVKPRQPLAASNPNKDLFINRGLDRKEGGKLRSSISATATGGSASSSRTSAAPTPSCPAPTLRTSWKSPRRVMSPAT